MYAYVLYPNLLKIELFSTKFGMNFSTGLEILYLCTCTRAIFSIGIQLRPVVSLTPFFCLQSPKRILEGSRVAPPLFSIQGLTSFAVTILVVCILQLCVCASTMASKVIQYKFEVFLQNTMVVSTYYSLHYGMVLDMQYIPYKM